MGNHHEHKSNRDTSSLRIAFFINLLFTIIEVIGGLYTNSLAILSDALHDLGDTIVIGASWFFQKKSKGNRDRNYSFGYKRFSVVGALLTSLVLLVGSIAIFINAIPRLIAPEATHSKGMIVMAIFGVVMNSIAYYRVHGGKSLNEKAVSLHLFEDVLGWVAILLGSIVIYFTGWYVLDPILSMAIAIYILIGVVRNLKDVIAIILQAIPKNISLDKVEASLAGIAGVQSFHDLHIWSLDGERNIASVHLVVANNANLSDVYEIKMKAKEQLAKLNIEHLTTEVEREQDDCHYDAKI